jgi:hypothetical protein
VTRPYSWLGCPHYEEQRYEEPDQPYRQHEPYGWTGERWTEDGIRVYFEECQADAAVLGEGPSMCGGLRYPNRLDPETLCALVEVARQAPNPLPDIIEAARTELERQLDGTHLRVQAAILASYGNQLGAKVRHSYGNR